MEAEISKEISKERKKYEAKKVLSRKKIPALYNSTHRAG